MNTSEQVVGITNYKSCKYSRKELEMQLCHVERQVELYPDRHDLVRNLNGLRGELQLLESMED